ncbi:EpsG family protein [Vibrio cyclitrophicus]|uniref:EpsG family protein n=1 Tax=Vibrio cyclitrophicus TaxID=47951 RepID=UPI000C825D2E|nr:EpsG family protein [Vibrio cyclitrophicus]PMN20047.1 hypothetical protein BCT37_18415 [Vibrio cyclitrophicus]
MTYLPIFIVLATLSLLMLIEQFRYNRKYFYIICSVILILFSGFRGEFVGSDNHSYIRIFELIPNILIDNKELSFSEIRMEWGYVLVNVVVKLFTSDFTYLFIVVAFISVGTSSYNYYKISAFPFLTLLLYFVHAYFYRDMNQLRAGLACSIALFSIVHIHEKRTKEFMLTIIVAAFFHMASTILILAYLFRLLEPKRKMLIITVFFGLLLDLLNVTEYVVQFIPDSLKSIQSTIDNYSNSQMYSQDLGLFNITNIKSYVILGVGLIFYERIKKQVPLFTTIIAMYTLSVSWRIAFSGFSILSGRVATFFEIVEVILVPMFCLLIKNKLVGHIIIIIYAFAIFYLNVFSLDRIPYYTSY